MDCLVWFACQVVKVEVRRFVSRSTGGIIRGTSFVIVPSAGWPTCFITEVRASFELQAKDHCGGYKNVLNLL